MLRFSLRHALVPIAVTSHSVLRATADYDESCGVHYSTEQQLTNWSSTHSATPSRLYEPRNAQETIRVLQSFHDKGQKIRAVGTALSPNGIGMASAAGAKPSSTMNQTQHEHNTSNEETCSAMLSLAALDDITVNTASSTVTVGAGAPVSAVLAELKKHGLTLENFSSIQEQQMGGWTQVSAHGTGISLPPVDEMIVHLQLATPVDGLVSLSEADSGAPLSTFNSIHPEANKALFRLCKVGLGCLGVVTSMTVKCIPRLDLVEDTVCKTRSSITGVEGSNADHAQRLLSNRHVRYMWIPYTDTVVQVTSKPLPSTTSRAEDGTLVVSKGVPQESPPAAVEGQGLRTQALCDLLLRLQPHRRATDVHQLSFSQLRDELLGIAPIDIEHVKAVNRAEAAFWQRSAGRRIDDSTNILGFDCGGEQWVLEVCLPMGTAEDQTHVPGGGVGKDISFVKELLDTLEAAGVPAPSPIEQRWTARSTAPMSPAFSTNPNDIFSWVGVIMYMPPNQSTAERAKITAAFHQYTSLLTPLFEKYNAVPHWAKIEVPGALSAEESVALRTVSATAATSTTSTPASSSASSYERTPGPAPTPAHIPVVHPNPRVEALKRRLKKRYQVELFNSYRRALDPKNILSNDLIDTLLPVTETVNKGPAWKKKAANK